MHRFAAATACWLIAGAALGAQETVYHIGNSITWDSRPNELWAMSENTDTSLTGGYHILCANSLEGISQSTKACVPPNDYGIWQEALPNNAWDHIIVQPFRANYSSLAGDVQAILTFKEAALEHEGNEDTQWWIYQSWPFLTGGELWSDWLEPTGLSTRHRQSSYLNLQNALREVGIDAKIIPTADVLFRYFNSPDDFSYVVDGTDLYRDDYHLISKGQLMVATTVLTALLGKDLTGTAQVGYDNIRPEDTRNSIQTLAWQVVNHYQNPGDYNSDGRVDALDYDLWRQQYGTHNAATDGNLDGVVDAADYAVWRHAFNAATSGVATAPSPPGAGLAVVALLSTLAGRRCAKNR